MPIALVESPGSAPAPLQHPPRKRWTRAEIQALESTGIWKNQKLELIEGDLFTKMPKKRRHSGVVALLHVWMASVFGGPCINTETPIDVAPEDTPTNEPEPDLIVLQAETWAYRENPKPSDLELVVEVSDSTVTFDLITKARLYARAGIREYWVFDIPARRLIVHRDPADGRFQTIVSFAESESVAPLARPASFLRVGDMLGPVE